MSTGSNVLSLSLPLGEYGWLYYAVSASVFLFMGVVCGYFIWRKGHMQTMDAEMEVQLNESELKSHTEEFEKEVRNLDGGKEGDRVTELLSNFGKEGDREKGEPG